MNAPINQLALDLTKGWMLSTIPVEERDASGQVHIVDKPKLFFLVCRALLKEWLSYGHGVNTDTVSSFNQVMLYREHFMVLYGGSPMMGVEETKDASDDEFFDIDWKRFKARYQ